MLFQENLGIDQILFLMFIVTNKLINLIENSFDLKQDQLELDIFSFKSIFNLDLIDFLDSMFKNLFLVLNDEFFDF